MISTPMYGFCQALKAGLGEEFLVSRRVGGASGLSARGKTCLYVADPKHHATRWRKPPSYDRARPIRALLFPGVFRHRLRAPNRTYPGL
jgi:hypothetical protein